MWATRLIPVAKKRGSESAPWMVAAKSSLKRPPTVETLTPDLLEHLALHQPAHSAARRRAVGVGALPGRVVEGGLAAASRSIASNSAQIRSRRLSNQVRARCCSSSSSIMASPARPMPPDGPPGKLGRSGAAGVALGAAGGENRPAQFGPMGQIGERDESSGVWRIEGGGSAASHRFG
jgi:hypothetical protein